MKTKFSVRRGIRISLPLTLCLLLAGCADYRLGSSLPAGLRSVYVPTFINQCSEPQLETDATSATKAEVQRDGTLQVASDVEKADAVMEVTLTDFKTEPIRYDSNDPKTAAEYRLKISAKLVFRKPGSDGKIMMKRSVVGEKTFTSSGDLVSSRQSAQPDAYKDLAHKLVEAVVEYW